MNPTFQIASESQVKWNTDHTPQTKADYSEKSSVTVSVTVILIIQPKIDLTHLRASESF